MAQNSNRRLNGINPLSYIGTNPYTPPDFVDNPRPPLPTDFKNFEIGTFWLDTGANNPPTSSDLYVLVDLSGNIATWIPLGGGGSGTVITLTSNSGGPVPALAGNINVVGDGTTITGVGNPGTNTITFSVIGGVIGATSFPTDAGTATQAAGILNVFGGTAGRDINTTGAGNTINVELNNAITLGDLAVLGAGVGAVTATTGDVIITAGSLTLPNTNAAGTQGVIKLGGNRWISNFGTLNTFVGDRAGNTTLHPVNAHQNVALGRGALAAVDGTAGGGFNNTAIGVGTLQALTEGFDNTFVGSTQGVLLTTGSRNSSYGFNGLANLTTGSYNLALGHDSGQVYVGAESSNVLINNDGVVGESNVMRIGTSGAGNAQVNKAFIAGIRGVTTDAADAIAVLISSTGQLGTISSSLRYKENIEDLTFESNDIYDLKPKSFTFKEHPFSMRSIGLIAEEVDEVIPSLVVYDQEGRPDAVKYHELPVLLLNELIKLRNRVDELEGRKESKKKKPKEIW